MDITAFASTPNSFGRSSRAITPSDTVDITNGPVKAVIAASAGNLKILPADNATSVPVAFVDIPAGFVPPFIVKRVFATGTTATVYSVEG